MNNNLLNAALEYASRDWPVLALHTPIKTGEKPVCSCKKKNRCGNVGKHPRWHPEYLADGVHSATTDEQIMRRWWTRWPHANVGIATGKESFDVLDVDIHGEDGNETLAEFERKHSRLPDTVEQITGSGGRQLLFMACEKIINAVKFAPGLDTRTDGGLIVAPPSLHASGRRYEWELSSMPGDVPIAAWPSWLIEMLTTNGNGKSKNPLGWQQPMLRGVSKGCRNQTAAKLAGLYITKGLTPLETYHLLIGWNLNNKPPLGKDIIERTIRSILTTHQRNNKTGDKTNATTTPKIAISFGSREKNGQEMAFAQR